MQGALVIRWTTAARGMEAKALEVFAQSGEEAARRVKDGEADSTEVFFQADTVGGFRIYRGEVEKLQALWLSSDFRQSLARANTVVEGIKVELYVGGDDDTIGEVMTDYITALGEVGAL